jgi:TonB family protein
MVKSRKNNKRKRALTTVGAVVAAGLTPGFIAVSATGATLQNPDAGVTAAEVVAIDGIVYGFDEIFAMQPQHIGTKPDEPFREEPQQDERYGVPWPRNSVQTDTIQAPREQTDVVYRSVEQMPQFPGGEAALMKYIQSNINYPPTAACAQGRAIVQFVVNKDGSVGEVKVVRSVEQELDNEAIRVVKTLPKFTPGRQNGKPVAVWYTLPVTFKLQGNYESQIVTEQSSKNTKQTDVVYRSVEQMPQFPGGEAALMKYIQSNINYPPMAAQNNIHGHVVVQMVIDETGQVGEVKVVRSIDEDLDKEAIRVCKSLPKFTPGRQNGQAVAVWYTLPVTFKLPK